MDPGSARERVLHDHERIREMLARIDAARKRFEACEVGSGRELQELGVALFEVFAAHLQLEDSTLVPALRARGPEGVEVARRLTREHEEQRALLRHLLSRLETSASPSALLAVQILRFAEDVRADMAYEEASVLSHLSETR